jgi:formylglycine-generating enzyme required for sulfatase activity
MTEDDILRTIAEDPPSAAAVWLILADWLEERSDARTELFRLLHDRGFRPRLSGAARAGRVCALLASGVLPVVPALTNSIGMRFVLVPAGTFLLGSPDDEQGRSDDEGPRHGVEVPQPFWLGAFPVTQQEYVRVVGANPSYFSAAGGAGEVVKGLDTSRFPVESVSWEDASAFCARLSALPGEQEAARAYRLPREVEWEYACRAGVGGGAPFHFGRALASVQANFHGGFPYGGAAEGAYLGRTTTVGSYPPNAWGLYDMHGNVWEWCADRYGKYPPRPRKGTARMLRGGSWEDDAASCRAACRGRNRPTCPDNRVGFRVCFPWGTP